MKRELNLSLDQALAIISVGNTITDEVLYKDEVKESLGKIFDESTSEKTYPLINKKGRQFKVLLSTEEGVNVVKINELISNFETRLITYSIKDGEIYQSLINEKDQVSREQKIAVCEILKECARLEEINRYEKTIWDFIDKTKDTFVFKNELGKDGSINKNFNKHPNTVLVKLGDNRTYCFPIAEGNAYKLILNEYGFMPIPLKTEEYQKIISVLKPAIENKSK